jgi:iron complex outermembrane receptor protein
VILGETSQGTEADFGHARNVGALFTELRAPVTKQVELSAALRYEYQGTGSATSPKLGLKYQPLPELALRASAGRASAPPACPTCTAR